MQPHPKSSINRAIYLYSRNLANDAECARLLPVDEVNGPGGLYKNVQDGILLWYVPIFMTNWRELIAA
jgi:hypothetical protein